jgi:hypothetical protein
MMALVFMDKTNEDGSAQEQKSDMVGRLQDMFVRAVWVAAFVLPINKLAPVMYASSANIVSSVGRQKTRNSVVPKEGKQKILAMRSLEFQVLMTERLGMPATMEEKKAFKLLGIKEASFFQRCIPRLPSVSLSVVMFILTLESSFLVVVHGAKKPQNEVLLWLFGIVIYLIIDSFVTFPALVTVLAVVESNVGKRCKIERTKSLAEYKIASHCDEIKVIDKALKEHFKSKMQKMMSTFDAQSLFPDSDEVSEAIASRSINPTVASADMTELELPSHSGGSAEAEAQPEVTSAASAGPRNALNPLVRRSTVERMEDEVTVLLDASPPPPVKPTSRKPRRNSVQARRGSISAPPTRAFDVEGKPQQGDSHTAVAPRPTVALIQDSVERIQLGRQQIQLGSGRGRGRGRRSGGGGGHGHPRRSTTRPKVCSSDPQ